MLLVDRYLVGPTVILLPPFSRISVKPQLRKQKPLPLSFSDCAGLTLPAGRDHVVKEIVSAARAVPERVGGSGCSSSSDAASSSSHRDGVV